MDFDNRWEALLSPGKATEFFEAAGERVFEAGAAGYSPVNAWWLAEFSRLIHRPRGQETAADGGPARERILEAAGLREMGLREEQPNCTFFRAKTDGENSYAALVFRGTAGLGDWVTNLNSSMVAWPGGGRVHRGFKAALERLWDLIDEVLSSLTCPVFYTGHSLGGALATLAAARRAPRALYTYGSPRVGDEDFGRTLGEVPVFRIANNRDVVTRVPLSKGLWSFRHVGELHYVAHDNGVLVNPDPGTVAADRRKRDPSLRDSTDYRAVHYPPQFLSDHTPLNYVAHLERHIPQ